MNDSITFACLATGDELIEGKTTNTNARNISEWLNSEGFQPLWHMTANDDERSILEAMTYLAERVSHIILTGGLGPTSDDRTRFALATYLKQPLMEHAAAIDHIQRSKPAVILSDGDRQQALFPKQAILLPNPFGTAMGCIVAHQAKTFILLPGPPRECLPMLTQHVLPFLKTQQRSKLVQLSWLLFGARESELARKFDDVLQSFKHDQNCQTGFRLDPPYVECKVRCLAEQVHDIQAKVEEHFQELRLLDYQQKASAMLIQKLQKHSLPLMIFDEMTGGRLQTTLTTAQTKPLLYVFSQNHAQDGSLKTPCYWICRGLDHYWQSNPEASNLIRCETWINSESEASAQLIHVAEQPCPFKTQIALDYAVEWLSAQIFISLDLVHQITT